MAYNTRFRFRFESLVSHRDIEILVKEDGYTGPPVNRAVGGAPVLRRDNGGVICGTSLEWPAECLVDEEYAELYTSDPMKFRTELRIAGKMVWSGFISTEMYADPEIAPPYDVVLTATDGLGELKNTRWPGMYDAAFPLVRYHSMHAILTNLLAATGQQLPIYYASELRYEDAAFFATVGTDIDGLAGESCYDVLRAILDSCHATLSSCGPCWVVMRETDLDWVLDEEELYQSLYLSGQGVDEIDDAGLMGLRCGSMQFPDCPNWTIGQTERQIIPARKRVSLELAASYRDSALPFSYAGRTGGPGWSAYGGASWSDGRFTLPKNGTVSNTIEFSGASLHVPLTLSLSLVNTGDLAVPLSIVVYALNFDAGEYYLVSGSDGSEDYGREGRRKKVSLYNYTWAPSGSISVNVDAAQDGTSKNSQQLNIDIPVDTGSRGIHPTALYVEIKNVGASTSSVQLVDASLKVAGERRGFGVRVNMSNGARGDDEERSSILFSNVDDHIGSTGTYTSPEAIDFMHGALVDANGTLLKEFRTRSLSRDDWGGLMAKDYAKSVAEPRLRRTGRVMASHIDYLPLHARLRQGGAYRPFIIESLEWDLLSSEMEVSMISLPAARLSVESTEYTEE